MSIAPAWRLHEQQDRRIALLAAARSVLAERGYHEATVEEIADRAAIGKGTVYLHFPEGKAAILAAVIDDHLAALRRLVVRSFVEGEGAVRYRFWTLALAAASYFRARPDLLRIHARELPRLLVDDEVGPAAERLARLTDELVGVVAPILDEAEDGAVMPSRIAAYHLLATLFGHLIAFGLHPRTEGLGCTTPPSEIADTLVALVFDGIAGHRATGC